MADLRRQEPADPARSLFHRSVQDDYEALAAEVYPRYQRALKAFNAVDFDDILMLTVRLLEEHPEVLAKMQQRFRYIMVDEYQDTNAAQYRLLRLLCAGHRNLCVVGDDDQSIYGWRGADLGNILDFEKDFPGATGHQAGAELPLHRQYPGRRQRGDPQQPPAQGKGSVDRRRGRGAAIDLLRCEDEEDEAPDGGRADPCRAFPAQARNTGDFAILYRTNVQSRAFEEQLRYENIPYVLIGGQQFFDRKEVKDAVAYFKVLVNPRDEVNLLRILNYPRRGIGETTADRLIRSSAEQERAALGGAAGSAGSRIWERRPGGDRPPSSS